MQIAFKNGVTSGAILKFHRDVTTLVDEFLIETALYDYKLNSYRINTSNNTICIEFKNKPLDLDKLSKVVFKLHRILGSNNSIWIDPLNTYSLQLKLEDMGLKIECKRFNEIDDL